MNFNIDNTVWPSNLEKNCKELSSYQFEKKGALLNLIAPQVDTAYLYIKYFQNCLNELNRKQNY